MGKSERKIPLQREGLALNNMRVCSKLDTQSQQLVPYVMDYDCFSVEVLNQVLQSETWNDLLTQNDQ